jgi:hypothetical protein
VSTLGRGADATHAGLGCTQGTRWALGCASLWMEMCSHSYIRSPHRPFTALISMPNTLFAYVQCLALHERQRSMGSAMCPRWEEGLTQRMQGWAARRAQGGAPLLSYYTIKFLLE